MLSHFSDQEGKGGRIGRSEKTKTRDKKLRVVDIEKSVGRRGDRTSRRRSSRLSTRAKKDNCKKGDAAMKTG